MKVRTDKIVHVWATMSKLGKVKQPQFHTVVTANHTNGNRLARSWNDDQSQRETSFKRERMFD